MYWKGQKEKKKRKTILKVPVIFLLDFGTVPTVWYILFFTLLEGQKEKKREKLF
jgi:flagellar basal body-associated protein FliL